jgi:predicted anti-sigma-YlaC factor YlaD
MLRTQPRSTALRTATVCGRHQSLRGSRCHHAMGSSPALSVSHRAAAGPRRTQPRSTALRTATVCGRHQSLRGSRCHHAMGSSPALSVSHRAAAGPRRTQPRSTTLRTATVCEAPVVAPEHRRHALGPSLGSRPLPPRCAGMCSKLFSRRRGESSGATRDPPLRIRAFV